MAVFEEVTVKLNTTDYRPGSQPDCDENEQVPTSTNGEEGEEYSDGSLLDSCVCALLGLVFFVWQIFRQLSGDWRIRRKA